MVILNVVTSLARCCSLGWLVEWGRWAGKGGMDGMGEGGGRKHGDDNK